MRQEPGTFRWAAAVSALFWAVATLSGAGHRDVSELRGGQHEPDEQTSSEAAAGKTADTDASEDPVPADKARAATYTRYLAEGSSSSFFTTQVALLNPGSVNATATIELLRDGLPVATHALSVPARTRRTFVPSRLPGFGNAAFAIKVTSDQLLAVDRTMYWNGSGHGAHAETAAAGASTRWYFAEGATTGGLDVFYLLQNPASTPTTVRVKYLRPTGGAPLVKDYALAAKSRTNIWVNQEEFPAGSGNRLLSSSEFAAVVESLDSTPIIAERSMYRSRPGRPFDAGHASLGVTAPHTRWFLAEGATGPWFDLFVLIANPTDRAGEVLVTYLLDDGRTFQRRLTAPANSRSGIWVDREEIDGVDGFPLENAAVSTTVESTNGVPLVVERTMWWPGGPDTWYEAHNSAGSNETGTRWALAEGEIGGPRNLETYVLIANTSAWSGQARVSLLFEDGTSVSRTYALAARSRTNAAIANDFGDAAAGRRFGILVESVGSAPAEIVVERAMYGAGGAKVWAAGTNAVGTRLPRLAGTGAADTTSSSRTGRSAVDGETVPVARAVTPSATTSLVNRYRLYSPITLEHLFTTDRNEYDTLTPTRAWQGEGVAHRLYNGPATVGGVTAVPYYRVYDKITRWHHWTTDLNEYEVLGRITARYNQEGIDGYLFKTQVPGSVPWYRLLYTAIAGLHHWTADQTERDTLVNSGGWVEEAKEYVYLPDPNDLAPSCEPGCDETIEGIDANLNTVRDDVERYIAQSGASEAEQLAMTDAAIALQEALETTPNEGEAVDRANEVMRTMECVRAVDESGTRAAEVVAEVNDTFGRSERWIGANDAVGGQVFPGGNSDISSCSPAVVQALPAARRAALLKSKTDRDSLAKAAAALPSGWTQVGSAGTNTAADGDVGLAPGLGSYQWVSTNGGVNDAGRLQTPTGQETNGSFAQTPTFTVAAGDTLKFYFNYITSDGQQYTEYAWAGLFRGAGAGTFDKYLFTARTTASGNTVPGFSLPGLGSGVTLTPSTTAIIAGAPTFSPLGDDSDTCFGTGCGYTGWVQMTYTFTTAGTYSLGFGVTNASDDGFDSALAIAGVAINNVPIDRGGPATLLYLNGVTTTLDVARDSHRLALDQLKAALTAEERAQLDGGDVLFVGEGKFLSDLLEAARQQGMSARDFWRTLRGLTPAPRWFQDRFVHLASSYGPETVPNVPQSQLERVRDRLRSGKRVIMVAHSQGNFVANALMDGLTSTERLSARIVSVANPDNRVAGGGPYTTLQEDLVVNAVRAVRPTTLGATGTNHFDTNLTDSNGWHGFREAYMTAPASRDRVVSHMVSAFRELVRPTQNVASGVITVSMTWGSQPDVDLHVTEPNGSHVYWDAPHGTSGFLDVDDRDGFGPEHYHVSSDTLETGTYNIGVDYFDGSGPETATVQIEAGGVAVRTFRVPLQAPSLDGVPIPVADIVVTRDPATGQYSYIIR